MKNKEQEEWIEAVLNSTEGMEKPSPSAAVFDRIQARIQELPEPVRLLPLWKIGIAASLTGLLITVNVLTIQQDPIGKERERTAKMEELADFYQLSGSSDNLYQQP